jgi:hypothetical protein
MKPQLPYAKARAIVQVGVVPAVDIDVWLNVDPAEPAEEPGDKFADA